MVLIILACCRQYVVSRAYIQGRATYPCACHGSHARSHCEVRNV